MTGRSQSLGCPYCGSGMSEDNVCPRCGTICRRCGTPYEGTWCPRCGGDDEEQARAGALASFGDLAPSRSDLRMIIGHAASAKEHDIARGIHVDPALKEVYDRASAAVEQLDVSQEARAKIMDGVEREAFSLWRRARRSGGGGRGPSLEKGVALAFLGQCRTIGRPVGEVQRALARAGFRIRMESVQVAVSSADPAGLRLLVNGRRRKVKVETSGKVVRVPIYLCDLLGMDGEQDGTVEIRLDGDGTIDDVRSPNEVERPDWRTVEVFAGRRCFYLFKAWKEFAVDTPSDASGGRVTAALAMNVDALVRRYQPSRFPVTATLMDEVGCLRQVELRFASLLREMMADARGRTPESVAASALYLADMGVFRALPPPAKSRAWSSVVRMGLARGGYLGTKGLLLKGEVGYDESVVQEEDFGRIGGDDNDGGGVG